MVRSKIKITDKKGWTGEEVGRLILKNSIHSYTEAMKGNRKPKPIFSQNELEAMVSNISYDNRMNGEIYNRYIALEHWLGKYVAITNSIYSTSLSEIKTITIIAENIKNIQDGFYDRSRLPIITTREQFEKDTLKLLKSYTKKHNPHYTLAEIIDQFIYRDDSKKVKKILKTYKKEAPKARDYLKSHWEEATGNENLEGLAELTKAEIIEDVFLVELYKGLFNTVEGKTEQEIEEEKEAFLEDFSDLATTALEEIKKVLALPDLTLDDMQKPLLTMEDAYLKNSFNYRSTIEDILYAENPNYQNGGVAFLADNYRPYFKPFENTIFEDRDKWVGLGGILQNTPDGENLVEMVQNSYTELKFCYQELLKYDTTIELLSEGLDMPEIKVFKQGSQDVLERVNSLFSYIQHIVKTINITYYRDSKEATDRRRALEQLFPPMNLESYKIPEDEINALKVEIMADLKVFKDDKNRNINDSLHPILEGVEYDK
ncbi:hypothetical protein RFK12_10910 [Streptococcus suis]|uniref:hypothetical protein n=1 Tax=Streptococcus suis TaxID=1307 RepID=UPI002FC5C993